MDRHLNLFAGQWVGTEFSENRNPSDLASPVGLYARAGQIFAVYAGEILPSVRPGIIPGVFLSAGQRCTASSWLIVTEGMHDACVAARVERMETLTGFHVPFGERKASSLGARKQGRHAVEFFTTIKTAYTFAGQP